MNTLKFIIVFTVVFLGISFLHAIMPTATTLGCIAYVSYEIIN